ncbi:MAG: GTP-binding protein, partial [Candidatus Thiodiazotropha sp. 6PLUC10]
QRPDPFRDLHFFLNAFKEFIAQGKVVVGVTQMDLASTPMIEDYHLQLENSGVKIPVFDIDARDKKDISILLEALLYSLDPCLDE